MYSDTRKASNRFAGALSTALRSAGEPAAGGWVAPVSLALRFKQNVVMARTSSPPHLIGNRVATAKETTVKVQEDIELAEAELHLANLVITDKLADSVSDADLAKAVEHNEQVEEKLHEAGEKLQVVTDLLHSEQRDQQRLDQAAREADGTSTPGARSGSGSASVIEHLRELTRHKLNTEPEAVRTPSKAARGKAARAPRST